MKTKTLTAAIKKKYIGQRPHLYMHGFDEPNGKNQHALGYIKISGVWYQVSLNTKWKISGVTWRKIKDGQVIKNLDNVK